MFANLQRPYSRLAVSYSWGSSSPSPSYKIHLTHAALRDLHERTTSFQGDERVQDDVFSDEKQRSANGHSLVSGDAHSQSELPSKSLDNWAAPVEDPWQLVKEVKFQKPWNGEVFFY